MTWGRIAFLRDGTSHTFPFTEHIMDGADNACVIGIVSPAYVLDALHKKCNVNHAQQFHIPFGL